MEYRDFDVRVDPDGNAFRVRASCGDRQATTVFQSDLVSWVGRQERIRGGGHYREVQCDSQQIGSPGPTPAETWASRVGGKLFGCLFGNGVGTLFDLQRDAMERSPGRGLRINLRLDYTSSRLARLAEVPWECLYIEEEERFLCQDRRFPLVRCLDVDHPLRPLRLDGDLKVLVVTSEPTDLAPLEVQKEVAELRSRLRRRPGVQVRVEEHTTRYSLRQRLLDGHFDVLHLIGHGKFDRKRGKGVFTLEEEGGRADQVDATDLTTLLGDCSGLSLIVFNGCDTDRGGTTDPLASVAAKLVREGLPAIVGMSSPILDRSACLFAESLYERLAAGDLIEAALTEARIALAQSESRSLADWVVPRLYLQVPHMFREERASREAEGRRRSAREPSGSGERRVGMYITNANTVVGHNEGSVTSGDMQIESGGDYQRQDK